jgi:hypothetical protein
MQDSMGGGDGSLSLSSSSEYAKLNIALSSGLTDTNSAVPSGVIENNSDGKDRTLSQTMIITSQLTHADDSQVTGPTNIYYDWKVFCNNNQNITNQLQNLSNATGTNLPTLQFDSNFPQECYNDNGEANITVELEANELRDGGGSNYGKGDLTFTAFNISNSILKAYKTEINPDTTTYNTTDQEICNDLSQQGDFLDYLMCRVLNNEIIAISVPTEIMNPPNSSDRPISINWTINDQPYQCDPNISTNCNTQMQDSIIVPIQGNSGDTINVGAEITTANQNTNQQKTLVRTFRITDPEVNILIKGGAVRKTLGTFIDLKKNQFTSTSDNTFISTEPTVTLFAALYPNFLNDQATSTSQSDAGNGSVDTTKTPEQQAVAARSPIPAETQYTYQWTLNGLRYSNAPTITFAPDGITEVGLTVTRALGKEERKALRDNFGIAQNDTTQLTFTDSKTIVPQELSGTEEGGFTATIFKNAPAFIIYILKMSMIIFVLLFLSILGIGGIKFGRE